MTYFWARWLADALRSDPFVAARLVEVPGWQDRGRPPSSTSFLPTGIVDHHTACMIRTGHDPQSCVNGIVAGNSVAPGPISQLLGTFTPPGVRWNGSNPDPRIVLIAAGRANHAGVGQYRWGAPSGNGSSIGVEWCGPPADGWPDVVVELRERVDAAILRWNGWTVDQLTTHWEYATPRGRKIDQSGRWDAQPALGQLTPWAPDVWRARVAARLTPPPVEGDDEMFEALDPVRVLDTRSPSQGPAIAPAVRRRVGVALDRTVKAAAINLTATDPSGVGWLVAWSGNGDAPGSSTLQLEPGRICENSAVVPVVDGHITVLASQACHLIVDVQGVWR